MKCPEIGWLISDMPLIPVYWNGLHLCLLYRKSLLYRAVVWALESEDRYRFQGSSWAGVGYTWGTLHRVKDPLLQ